MWLKIQGKQTSYLKVTWGNQRGPHPVNYLIGYVTLERVANKARSVLNRLSDWARVCNKDELPSVLHALADVGQELRQVLLEPVMGTDVDNVNVLERWIASDRESGDTELTIITDVTGLIPWALVFDGDSRSLPGSSVDIGDFSGFWGLAYNLSTLFAGLIPDTASRCRPK